LPCGEGCRDGLFEGDDDEAVERTAHGVPVATATVFVCENASTASAPFSRP
jgi:hypothetical protein